MWRVLTHPNRFIQGRAPYDPAIGVERPLWTWPLMIVAFAPIYGAVMGSYELDSTERLWQVAFSAVKAPLLLFASGTLCLLPYFIINTIAGLRDDFRASIHAILAGQAGLSITLAALSPLTRFWYFTESSYRAALLFNAGMFTLATIAGHIVTLRYYGVLIRRNRRHRVMLYLWICLYAFVGIQMGWLLRPFIGSPNMPVSFLRENAFTNAYVVVSGLIFGR